MLLNLQQLLLLLITGANLLIGIWVVSKNPRHIINQSFFLFVAGSSAWAFGVSLLYITHSFVFDKLALGGGFLLLFGMTLFARVFPSASRLEARSLLIFIPLCFGVLLLPFDLFIKSIEIDSAGMIEPLNGPLYPFFAAIVVGYLVASIYYFIQNFKLSVGRKRMQMLYVVTGTVAFAICLTVFDAILPLFGIYRFNLLGPAASVVFVLMTSWAIVRHQLLDIRIIIQRSVIYSLLISLIIGAYIFLLILFHRYVHTGRHIREALSAGIIMLAGILGFPHVEKYFKKVTDHLFFKDHYRYPQALEELSSVLNEHLEQDKLVEEILKAIKGIFKPRTLEFYSTTATEPENGLLLELGTPAHPLGAFVFGPKRSGDPYTSEDRMLLRTFAIQATVAFGKAELHQQLHEYSHSLEEKVAERTQSLQELQDYQRQFFDDISHALQTPLTIVKSGVESLTQNNSGVEQTTIERIDHSLDDLSRLVRDLLELARLDAIPPDEPPVEINLSNMLNEISDDVEIICKQPQITVRRSIQEGITLLGNYKQISTVVTNLLSNAVRYTAACAIREINVSLKKTSEGIEISIQDTGIGIPEDLLRTVFTRFYRASDKNGIVGYGLGLAIVQKLVERHRGSIEVKSILRRGTCFTITFPCSQEITLMV